MRRRGSEKKKSVILMKLTVELREEQREMILGFGELAGRWRKIGKEGFFQKKNGSKIALCLCFCWVSVSWSLSLSFFFSSLSVCEGEESWKNVEPILQRWVVRHNMWQAFTISITFFFFPLTCKFFSLSVRIEVSDLSLPLWIAVLQWVLYELFDSRS